MASARLISAVAVLMPRAAAWAAVRPAAAISGSANTTRGIPSYEAVRGRPRMLSAATRPWYMATRVNKATPVTFPGRPQARPGLAPPVDGDPAAPGQHYPGGV